MRIASFLRTGAVLLALAALPAVAQQGAGYLKLKVDPGRAGVFIDGKYVGPAGNFGHGRKYAVAPGEHEVKLLEPRYEDVVTKVTIVQGKTVKLAQSMKALPAPKPPFGMVRVASPDKFDAVYFNGKFMGHAGEFNNSVQGLKLNPGEYAVRIVPVGGGQVYETPVKVEADKTVVVRYQK